MAQFSRERYTIMGATQIPGEIKVLQLCLLLIISGGSRFCFGYVLKLYERGMLAREFIHRGG